MTDDALGTYREAIRRGDADSLSAVFADNIQLRVPLFSEPLTLEVGGVQLQGLEHVHFDDDGLVDLLLVALRPLEGLITMHNTIAPLIGQPRLQLVAQDN